jgi:hypothetical protein
MSILSSTSAVDNELRENRIAANSVDKDGAIQAKIECVTNEENMIWRN